MSPKRAPSAPPELPGYEYVSLLGSGGFADVFLYQQLLPSRQVAIKVLLPDAVNRELIENFRHEANVMAQLSTHPSIVTIYGAAVAPDGRPYLAMEYCSKPNLGVRYRRDRFAVPEVLSLGVQIAGAVETAHRAGILHRDIKPANILVTAYNRPALTDFGIATSAGGADDASGMSIPWSPPEAFQDPPRSTPASDVFSLAATLSTLLAGRTPFELPGGSNTSVDLIDRIQRGEISPLARHDVPPRLEAVLASAMDPDPSRRYATAMAFGRALQQVEAEMALPVTPLDVLDDSLDAGSVDEEDGGATRIRGVVSIDPHAGEPAPAMPLGAAAPDATIRRPRPDQAAGAPAAVAPEPEAAAPDRRRRTIASIVGAALVVLVGGGIVWLAVAGSAPTQPPANPSQTIAAPAAPQRPPAPINVVGTVEGDSVTFTWVNAQPQAGDSFRYRYEPSDADPTIATAAGETVTVQRDSDGESCILVTLVRSDGRQSNDAKGCVNG
ncbi:serine/threonine-protein kinase [Agrococcus sp. Marseille-Q4369]|uniref:serine/threonine-protein kinase n=1 Tax=Agrococcus sp. Marseille-Q4369 TaxID=2810513 RepID=UPI001B8C8454|nr:serine/threonine-protein kinase [Agrococcus sp. Marseille-Q4369]QUW17690.1 serine/threonine protein kinase [Agrococcus sp. Marseille-Q4369]